jgi:hypothetical protein
MNRFRLSRDAPKLLVLCRSVPLLAAMLLGMLVVCSSVFSSQTMLVWDRCLDPEVIGYRLHYGNSSRDYSVTVEVDNETTCTVADLVAGIPYFFAVTAYDRYGNQSDFSDEVSQTIYEDAEDLSSTGWDFCSLDIGGGEIRNVVDEELQRNVIELSGSGLQNCYRLRRHEFTDWNNASQFVIAWKQKFSELFRVTVMVASTAGNLELRYAPLDDDFVAAGSIVRFGVGSQARDGQWHHVTRDLQADLDHALPGVKILQIKRLLVRGSGRLTDIKLISAAP